MNQQLTAFYDILSTVMDPEFNRLVEEVAKPHSSSEEYMRLPDQKDSTLSVADVSVLIAQSSNKYSAACRLASMARARAKIAEAAYKHKFRTSMGEGSNKESREAAAALAAEEEHDNMIFAQAVVELCESFESSNRIASESARRLLLAAEQERRADYRGQEHSGSLMNNNQW